MPASTLSLSPIMASDTPLVILPNRLVDLSSGESAHPHRHSTNVQMLTDDLPVGSAPANSYTGPPCHEVGDQLIDLPLVQPPHGLPGLPWRLHSRLIQSRQARQQLLQGRDLRPFALVGRQGSHPAASRSMPCAVDQGTSVTPRAGPQRVNVAPPSGTSPKFDGCTGQLILG